MGINTRNSSIETVNFFQVKSYKQFTKYDNEQAR